MMKIENHEANTTVIIIAGKSHRWMLNLVEKKYKKQDICIISKHLLTRYLLIMKENKDSHSKRVPLGILILQ